MAATQNIQLLDKEQIQRIIDRMSYQVLEFFYKQDYIFILGIETGGSALAKQLETKIQEISEIETKFISMKINKTNRSLHTTKMSDELPQNASILLVDDVANSGGTLSYALAHLLEYHPRQVTLAVLVDRKHKRFPVMADIVGKKLSTNINETVLVEFDESGEPHAAFLTDK